jgi:hypothetical protein
MPSLHVAAYVCQKPKKPVKKKGIIHCPTPNPYDATIRPMINLVRKEHPGTEAMSTKAISYRLLSYEKIKRK